MYASSGIGGLAMHHAMPLVVPMPSLSLFSAVS
jgi:hypothetical protein